jgi:hypothetical protein
MAQDKEIMDALRAKIYAILSAGDNVNNIPSAGSTLVSFCIPGIPLAVEDLDFGFLSQNVNQLNAASAFFELVDTIPKPTGFWNTSNAKMSEEYEKILTTKLLPISNLSQSELTLLSNAKRLLVQDVEIIDLYTGQRKTVPGDTPLFEKYKQLKADYENALLKYNNLYLNMVIRGDQQSRMEWSINGPVFQSQLSTSFQTWLPVKQQIEQALSIIENLDGRGPTQYWSGLLDDFRRSKRTDASAMNFLLTKYFPESFWDDAHKDSWTKFSFKSSEIHTVDTRTSTSWGGGAGVSFGLWSIGGDASYGSQYNTFSSDGNNLQIDVDLVKIPLRRSWFNSGIFASHGWKFDPNVNRDLLSDGGTPPKGTLVGYSTSLIIARNLLLSMDLSSTRDSYAASQFSTSMKIGWGPFSIRGNYTRTTQTSTHDFKYDAGAISCPGMQIIGFINELLPKSPDPDQNLNWPQ